MKREKERKIERKKKEKRRKTKETDVNQRTYFNYREI